MRTSSSLTTPSSIVNERSSSSAERVDTSSQCGKPAVAAQRTSVRDGVGLGRGVRVVDDQRLLVGVVDVARHPQPLPAVEDEAGRRPLGVGHLEQPGGSAVDPGDHAAALVRVVPAGVRDDAVDHLLRELQHAPQPSEQSDRVRGAGSAAAPGRGS
jgi:hypothetical protein